ncbi:type IV secretory system conjugative DNA transfer family protein [Aerococcaceae bacterium NML191292]|nr:type IV secretory system conjugative DNA transfer family protein [Aerococcaceae bacterium NML191292]MCW6675462.1 type IV secretory system conjugative DNA transfer family protein [Aerococcaceae bacterium NML171108]
MNKVILFSLYTTIFYLSNRFIHVTRMSFDEIGSSVQFIPSLMNKLSTDFVDIPSFYHIDLIGALVVVLLLFVIFYARKRNGMNWRRGEEHGSARWGGQKDRKPFISKNPQDRIILSQTEFLQLKESPKEPKYNRNKNVLIVGGAGSGKTRFYVKPNIAQMHSSYVVTDPKGTLLEETGEMLLEAGYKIKTLNLNNTKLSHRYNPFAYINSDSDILRFANALIENTKGDGEKTDFWVKAEQLFYIAMIALIHYEYEPHERNFESFIELLDHSEVDIESNVDIIFKTVEKRNPKHFAVRQYKKFKKAAGKSASSILLSCGVRLSPFDIQEMLDLTQFDELELDTIGDEKTALFIVTSDNDTTFNFMAAIAYTQMFGLLIQKADANPKHRLDIPVRFILDEFANIGLIPNFDKIIAVIRSRHISVNVILQSISQLKTIYKNNYETIIGNCDTTIFLGGKEESTKESLSKSLGKSTIDVKTRGESHSTHKSFSYNYQKIGRNLFDAAEIEQLDGGMCIVQIRGAAPFLSKKYNVEKHPNYKLLNENFDKPFNISQILQSNLIELSDEQPITLVA